MADPSRPLRVVFCSHSLGRDNGVARVESCLFRLLPRDRFDPLVLFTDAVSPESASPPALPPGYVHVPVKGRFEALLGHLADADVAHVSWPFDPVAWEAAAASGVPVLLETMHNPSAGGMHPALDRTVCVSRAVQAMQPDPGRTAVIHNGVDLEELPFRTDRDTGTPVLLELSRRSKTMHWHLDQLAGDLLDLHPRLELWLAGAGQDPLPGAPERIRFLGLSRDAAGLLGRAHLLVLLSRQEPFGLAAAEAMACGCLPLVADDGGMAEIVAHGETGWLVAGHDRRAVRAAVSRALELLGTPAWRAMQERGRTVVEDLFPARRCVREYADLYRELVRLKGRRIASGPLEAEPPPEVDLATAVFRFAKKAPLPEVVEDLLRMAGRSRPLTRALVHPGWEDYLRLARFLADQAAVRGLPKAAERIRCVLAGG